MSDFVLSLSSIELTVLQKRLEGDVNFTAAEQLAIHSIVIKLRMNQVTPTNRMIDTKISINKEELDELKAL